MGDWLHKIETDMICWEPICAVFRDDFVKACQMPQLSHKVGRVGPHLWESWAIHGQSWVTHQVCHITTKMFTTFFFKGMAYLQHLPYWLSQLSPQMRGEMGQPLGRVGPFSIFLFQDIERKLNGKSSTSLKRC